MSLVEQTLKTTESNELLIPDAFMRAVEENSLWCKYRAQEVWDEILEMNILHGEPRLIFEDRERKEYTGSNHWLNLSGYFPTLADFDQDLKTLLSDLAEIKQDVISLYGFEEILERFDLTPEAGITLNQRLFDCIFAHLPEKKFCYFTEIKRPKPGMKYVPYLDMDLYRQKQAQTYVSLEIPCRSKELLTNIHFYLWHRGAKQSVLFL